MKAIFHLNLVSEPVHLVSEPGQSYIDFEHRNLNFRLMWKFTFRSHLGADSLSSIIDDDDLSSIIDGEHIAFYLWKLNIFNLRALHP